MARKIAHSSNNSEIAFLLRFPSIKATIAFRISFCLNSIFSMIYEMERMGPTRFATQIRLHMLHFLKVYFLGHLLAYNSNAPAQYL
jgi:hypothetical protein